MTSSSSPEFSPLSPEEAVGDELLIQSWRKLADVLPVAAADIAPLIGWTQVLAPEWFSGQLATFLVNRDALLAALQRWENELG